MRVHTARDIHFDLRRAERRLKRLAPSPPAETNLADLRRTARETASSLRQMIDRGAIPDGNDVQDLIARLFAFSTSKDEAQ